MFSTLLSKFRGFAAVGLVTLCAPVCSFPSAVVTGSVFYDSSTELYTYSYTLENVGGHGRIDELVLAVNSIGPGTMDPVSYTAPDGWILTVGWSPSSSTCEIYNLVCHGEWMWGLTSEEFYKQGGLMEGETLSGLSFQTAAAPMVTDLNTYFVYFPDARHGYVEAGRVVVPDFQTPYPPPTPNVPEPAPLTLVAGGLTAIVAAHEIRRSR